MRYLKGSIRNPEYDKDIAYLNRKVGFFLLSERLDYRDMKIMFSPTVQGFFLTPLLLN